VVVASSRKLSLHLITAVERSVSFSNAQFCQERTGLPRDKIFLALSWRISDLRTTMHLYSYMRQIWLHRDDRQAELHDIGLKAGTYSRSSHANSGPVLSTKQKRELA
jgi:hypothetical protein